MTINERVKQVRLALNLTQKEMGQRLTLAQTYLSQIEKGDRDVTDKIFKIICLEYNVNEEWLRNGTGSMFNETHETIISEVAAQYHLDEIDKEILRIFVELPPEKRKILREFAYSIAGASEKHTNGDINVFRVARSIDNSPPEIINCPSEKIERFKNLPKVTRDEDL